MRKLTTAVMRTPGSIGVVPMWNVPTSLKLGLPKMAEMSRRRILSVSASMIGLKARCR